MVSIGPLEIDFRFGRRRRSPLIYLIALVLLGGAWLLRSDPSWVRALEGALAEPAATSFQLSEHTDFDIMSTPFKRDIMKELADACRAQGIRVGWYHSIMDWHHPDYLPRRGWEPIFPASRIPWRCESSRRERG